MTNAPMSNQVTVLMPEAITKPRFVVRIGHAHGDAEGLMDVERATADLLADRYEEALASPAMPEALARIAGTARDTDVMTYHDALARLRITVSGLSLQATAESSEVFLKPVAADLVALLRDNGVQPAGASADLCVCATTYPGTVYPLDQAFEIMATVPAQDGRWRWTTLFKGTPRPEDAIAIEVPEARTLPSNEAEIGLGNRTDWDKQITAWTFCRNRTVTIEQRANQFDPVFMRLREARCYSGEADTIVFRKQKFLGIWTDMITWHPTRFWELHGGRRITYMWCWHGGGGFDPGCGGWVP